MLDCKLMKNGKCTCNMQCAKYKAYNQAFVEIWNAYDKMGRGAFESWMKERIKDGSKY